MSDGHDPIPHEPAVGELSCRFGYLEHHAVFALLQIAVLVWFLHSAPRAPSLLRGLIAGNTLFNIAIHMLLCGTCRLSFISVAVHAHLHSFPPFQMFSVGGVVNSAVTAHFVMRDSGRIAAAKLVLLLLTAAVHILALGSWWWTPTKQLTAQTMLIVHLSAAFMALETLVFLYSATKTRVLGIMLLIAPAWFVGMAGLNAALYPLDWPDKTYLQNPHWSAILRSVLFSGFSLANRAATSHAVIISQPRSYACRMAPFAAATRVAKLKASEWFVLAIVVIPAAIVSTWLPLPTSSSNKQYVMPPRWVQELFTQAHTEAISPLLLLLLPCGCSCALLLAWVSQNRWKALHMLGQVAAAICGAWPLISVVAMLGAGSTVLCAPLVFISLGTCIPVSFMGSSLVLYSLSAMGYID